MEEDTEPVSGSPKGTNEDEQLQIPVQVTLRDLPDSDAIREACFREAEKLERYSTRITSCRIVVAQPHRHSQTGNPYSVHVDLTLPGGEIVVTSEPREHDSDVNIAIRTAFDAVRRRLEDFIRKQRGDVKRSESAELPG